MKVTKSVLLLMLDFRIESVNKELYKLAEESSNNSQREIARLNKMSTFIAELSELNAFHEAVKGDRSPYDSAYYITKGQPHEAHSQGIDFNAAIDCKIPPLAPKAQFYSDFPSPVQNHFPNHDSEPKS